MNNKRQLFVILGETVAALSFDEVDATVKLLKENGLFSLPFDTIDVRIHGDCIATFSPEIADRPETDPLLAKGFILKHKDHYITNFGKKFWCEFRNINLSHFNYQKMAILEKGNALGYTPYERDLTDSKKYGERYCPKERERDLIAELLIVLLSTRNIVKTTKRDKLAALGIGKSKHKHEYVTTISLPHDLESDPDHVPQPGQPKCPHLRRAHMRSQHYGPKNALIKRILVPAVIVNSDKEWTKTRTAYNLSI